MATTWQVPRCSAMLRHFQRSQNLDLEEVAVERERRLERRQAARQQRAESQGNVEWTRMFGELERASGNAARTKDMRARYSRFMKLVADIAAEGSTHVELHAIALYLYNQITSRTIHGEHLKKQAVEGMLGPIAKPVFREMKQIVDDLAANWVHATTGGSANAAKQAPKKKAAAQAAALAEFGEAVGFVLPFVHRDHAAPDAAAAAAAGGTRGDDTYVGWEEAAALEPEPQPQPHAAGKIDYRWLVDQCGQVLGRSGTGGSVDEAMDLAQNMQQMLSTEKTDDELQNDLFDLLGDFEFIAVLLANRTRIAYMQPLPPDQLLEQVVVGAVVAQQTGQHAVRLGVSLQTEEEKKFMKMQRKQQQKQHKRGGNLQESPEMASHASVVQARREAWQEKFGGGEELADVVAALPENTGRAEASAGWGQRMTLPKGTVRKQLNGYEEVPTNSQYPHWF